MDQEINTVITAKSEFENRNKSKLEERSVIFELLSFPYKDEVRVFPTEYTVVGLEISIETLMEDFKPPVKEELRCKNPEKSMHVILFGIHGLPGSDAEMLFAMSPNKYFNTTTIVLLLRH